LACDIQPGGQVELEIVAGRVAQKKHGRDHGRRGDGDNK
jgi:hypothetical protein